MSFNIAIKVDPGSAVPVIKQVTTELGKAEDMGPRVGASISQGLKEGSTAAEKAKAAFGALAEVFQREADILEKIHGPAKEYAADLQAIDSLHAKGMVTTQQYIEQVTRLNEELEKSKSGPKAPEEEKLTVGGAAKDSVMEALPALGALEIGKSMTEAIEASEKLQDRYTELTNRALKFADATHTTDDVINEQVALAHQLHASLDATSEIYDRVREGSDDLNLSHAEQLRLTQSLGEAFQIANKPISETGSLMSRLSYAMASGTIDTREMRQIMREVPPIADLWTKSFGVTRTELISMVTSGKKSIGDLMQVLIDQGKVLDDSMAKRQRSNELTKEETIRNEELRMSQGKTTGTLATVYDYNSGDREKQAIEEATNAIELQTASLTKMSGAWSEVGRMLNDQVLIGFGKFNDLATKSVAVIVAVNQANAPVVAAKTELEAWTKALDSGGVTAEQFRKKYLELQTTIGGGKLAPDIKMDADMNAATTAIEDARKQLAVLNEQQREGGLSAEYFRQKYKELATTINNGVLPESIRVYEDIFEPQRKFAEGSAALNALLAKSKITTAEYDAELNKLIGSYGGAEKLFNDAGAEKLGNKLNAKQGGFAPQLDVKVDESGPADALQNQQIARSVELYNQARTSAEKYADELGELNALHASVMGDQAYNAALANLKEKYAATASSAEKLNNEARDARDLNALGVITATEMAKRLDDIAKEQEKIVDSGKTMEAGLSRGWHSIRDEVNDTATTIAAAMKGAFDQINADIVQLVMTGTADFGKLITSIEQDLLKLSLQSVEKTIMGGLGIGGGALAGAAGAGGGSPITSARVIPAGPSSVGGGSGGSATARVGGVTVVNANDPHAAALAAMNTRQGELLVMNTIHKNIDVIRGHVTKR